MSPRSPEQRDADRAKVLALVESCSDASDVHQGMSRFSAERFYLEASDLRHRAGSSEIFGGGRYPFLPHFAADLAALAQAGRIDRIKGSYSPRWRYASLSFAEAWARERDLSDAVRAERTAAEVVATVDRNRREYGDRVGLWPATNLRLSDGVRAAIDAGLIVERRSTGLGRDQGYLPADSADAYDEALAVAEAAAARAREIHADLAAELDARGYPGQAARLDTESLRWLLDRLPETPCIPNPGLLR